jgi:hypothetical protein
MDETPEELEQIRREAAQIDPYQYRRRGRIVAAIALGALGAGLVWVVLELNDRRRNPCQRVQSYFCAKAAASPECGSYSAILKDSVEDSSPKMRSAIRDQCLTKIKRLGEEGIRVP